MDCSEWLKQKLDDKEYHLCDNIRREAKEKRFDRKELKKVRKILGVKTYHQFDDLGRTPNWYWYME